MLVALTIFLLSLVPRQSAQPIASVPGEAPAPATYAQIKYSSPPPAHAGRFYFDPVDPAFFANITRPSRQNYNSTDFIEANSSSITPAKVTPSNGTFVLNGTAVGAPPAAAPSGSSAGVESSLPDVYDYGMALNYSLLFYEAQRSGPNWPNNRINWRFSSALDDANPSGGNLTGGWYDAGDHLILNFPAAFSATLLAYGLIEFHDAYAAAGQTQYAMSNLRWVADYFVKCHYSDVIFNGQVGDVGTDHGGWLQAEALPTYRPSFEISPSAPGSDLLGETAAALAAISMVFESSDADYAATLEAHARDIYALGTSFEGKYSNSISEAYVYPSSNYLDDLAFGAAWMYRKTGEEHFLDDAENYWTRNRNEEGGGGYLAFSWDTAVWGVDMMLTSLTTNNLVYQNEVIRFLESWVTGQGGLVQYTSGGLAWSSPWGTLRYTMNAAFIAVVFAQSIENSNVVQSRRYSCWARGQVHYILGSNPKQFSYLVGYGSNYPLQVHHRGASCPNVPTVCNYDNFNLNQPNPHVIYGAMVGGPDQQDAYTDSRSNYQQAEPAVDYNAGLTGVLAYLSGTGDTYAACQQRGDVVKGPSS